MCDLCELHGEGRKWYLNPKFYAKDFLGSPTVTSFVNDPPYPAGPDAHKGLIELVDMLLTAPSTIPVSGDELMGTNQLMLSLEGIQVAPLEDIVKILDLPETIDVVPCYCRKIWGDWDDHYSCLHFTPFPEVIKKRAPWRKERSLTTDEAKDIARSMYQEGKVPLIVWYPFPYVCAICACELPYCLALRGRISLGATNATRKAEYYAMIDPKKCDGCGGKPECLLACQFGAMKFNKHEQVAFVVPNLCFGCGVCRTRCPREAITLKDRNLVPTLKNQW